VAPHSTPPGRPRRALLAALTALVSLALSFTVVEWFARGLERRVALAKVRSGRSLALMRENPHGTGSYRLKPGLDLTTRVKGLDVRIRTNSHGMAWRDVERARAARPRRVAFLGDSFTFGCWARSYERSFVGVFEAGLNRERVEALNFGVGGYGLLDEELLLREEAITFGPDWVIVMLFVGNDFRDTWLGLDKERLVDGTAQLRDDVLAQRVPAEFVQAEARPAPPAPDPSRLRAGLMSLATFRLLLPRLGWHNPWIAFTPSRNFTWFSFWSLRPAPPVALQARDAALAALQRMDAFAREHGARLGVVTIPYREQVYAQAPSGRGWDTAYPQAWVERWADEQGVPHLDLLPRLRGHALRTDEDVYLEDDIHWNERGHELVGGWLREWFTAELRQLE
jgi:lysophospholipase L1-like esterase